MGYVTYTELRENLARYMDEAVESRAPIVVTRQGGKGAVVMLSLEEFEGWQETVHLLSSPRNAEILLRSIKDANEGRVEEHALIRPDDISE
ncbi:MAG: type II toxin-antitoxin system prevent-host-death family antitoxin [Acetobacteraceae bacterium]